MRRDEDLVHSLMLKRQAELRPDAAFAIFPEHGEERWTYRQADAEVNRAAHMLRSLGVSKGDAVAFLHEASPNYVRFFLGALRLGAVPAPLNDGFRGGILEHALNLSRAKVILVGTDFLERLAEVTLEHLRIAIVPEGASAEVAASFVGRLQLVATLDVRAYPETAPDIEPIHFFDPYAIVFTSGTTGPSKGVVSCYGQIHATLKDNVLAWVRPDDIFHVDVPIFHISGLLSIYTALTTGCTLVIYPKFRATEYWNRIRRYNATVATIVTVDFLWRQKPSERDRQHKLRLALTGMFPPYSMEWQDRFGVDELFQIYNMSEISAPIQSGRNPVNRRAAGKAREGVELRIVDENDFEVPVGQAGQLVLRLDRPWEIFLGYLHNPEATGQAWRNGWFHTGDAFYQDKDGYYYFVDRLKDCIRRRGENISSYEVEREILAHPVIMECAVVAAPGLKAGDQEVHAFVVPKPGMSVSAGELSVFLERRMARFMMPRYIDVMESLPRNPSTKIMKKQLREQGVTDATWDREAPGKSRA